MTGSNTEVAPKRDIVDRLRNDGSSWAQDLFNQAADEIERLRAEKPKGCVCPPTAEQTCTRWDCGRKSYQVKF